MVSYTNDIRKQFMGTDSGPDALSVTLSTRTLLRWAGLTLAYHPLSAQDISPIIHALDRALAPAPQHLTKPYCTNSRENISLYLTNQQP